MQNLIEVIRRREARCGIIGLGYVGLPLALEFARAGFRTTGIDVDAGKVDAIRRGRSYIVDVTDAEIAEQVEAGRLTATTDFAAIAALDTINICVPTPLRKTKDPDLTFIVSAVNEITRHLRCGQLVILESTTYPGTTEEVVQPALEASGLEVGRDICLAFSPERIDPGNAHYKTRNIPKVVGGVTPHCTEVAKTLYEQCVETVVAVSSPRVAEMVKLLENTFRSVNIGLVNEIALMSHALQIDVWEVIDAAKTKPFGFMAFYPGPGLGGHCIPIDPFYLSWKAKMNGFEPRFIELAGHINEGMPRFVVEKVTDALNTRERSVRGSRIHVLGVAYKPGVNDIRESPALNVMRLLQDKGAILSYSDPYVPAIREERLELDSLPLQNGYLGNVDCVVILTHHREFDYPAVARTARLVVDTRNALAGVRGDNIVRL
jgi:UDP-N-acetyl-D-glucosamine dehydrogenase